MSQKARFPIHTVIICIDEELNPTLHLNLFTVHMYIILPFSKIFITACSGDKKGTGNVSN